VLQGEKRIRTRVKRQMEKTQREYYLNEQMKAIQKRTGRRGRPRRARRARGQDQEDHARRRARDKGHPRAQKLARCRPCRRKHRVRNYLDWFAVVPWGKKSKNKKDLPQRGGNARSRSLSALEKVKERIVEYLAVRPPKQVTARPFAWSVRLASARPRSLVDRQGDRREFVRCRSAACG